MAAETDTMTVTETEIGMAVVDETMITVRENDNTTAISTTIERSAAISEQSFFTPRSQSTLFEILYY